MKVLLIINSVNLARSLQRYLFHIYNYPSEYIYLNNTPEHLPPNFYTYDIYITDIYGEKERSSKVIGLHLGDLLEGKERKVLYFFTKIGLKEVYPIQNLPANYFYLPLQLGSFLYSIKEVPVAEKSANQMLNNFQSTSLTSGHH
jgi:hypothetical protein